MKNIAKSTVVSTLVLCVLGLVLIILGMSVDFVVFHVKTQDILSNVGALFLVIGTLQIFFDENSREGLINRIKEGLDERDRLRTLGVDRGLVNSKEIGVDAIDQKALENADKFVIGVHYSDGTIVRFEKIIKARLSTKKNVEILHSDPKGKIAPSYLENSLASPFQLSAKVIQFQSVMQSRFGPTSGINLVPHDRVLRYSFIYCEKFIWIIFMTNSAAYIPQVPTMKIVAGTPLFDFFYEDIKGLGATI